MREGGELGVGGVDCGLHARNAAPLSDEKSEVQAIRELRHARRKSVRVGVGGGMAFPKELRNRPGQTNS